MQYEIHRAGTAGAETLIASFATFTDARDAYDADPEAWAIIPTGRADELAAFDNLYSIAPRYYGGMYVLRAGDGFSTLGFENADRKGRAVAEWAGFEFGTAVIGTGEHFTAYKAAMAKGAAFALNTGRRCPAELTPELIPFEGKRVRVTRPGGETETFTVGKSTGWMPCHLEIKGRSSGGPAVFLPAGSSVSLV